MSLEQLLICHCAPVFNRIKVSNLVSCSFKDYPELENDLLAINEKILPYGLKSSILCKCERFALVFVYDLEKLQDFLLCKPNFKFLSRFGYKIGLIENFLERLSGRLKGCQSFPHEIGVFLGYPLEDVVAFTENNGKNYKYSGYWKVYGNIEKAKKTFSAYDECSKRATVLAMDGVPLEKIIKSKIATDPNDFAEIA